MTAGVRQRWLRSYRPRPGRTVTLVCFPHACGSASFYRPWLGHLPDTVELCAVQYPGHEDRFGEPCLEDLHHLADEVAELLRTTAATPLVLFGHSLGAAIAYEVAVRLSRRTDVDLAQLMVSGRPAPHVAGEPPHFDTDDELWRELERLGGTGSGLLDNPRMRSVFTPMLRSDFRMNSTYRGTDGDRLRCAVSAYRGAADDTATDAQMRRWADVTTGGFSLREFAGGHFYLQADRTSLLRDVTRRICGYDTELSPW